MAQDSNRRRRARGTARILLVTRDLAVGSLLTFGCGTPPIANPKGSLQDDGAYDAPDAPDAGGEVNVISNPKGSLYNADAYKPADTADGATASPQPEVGAGEDVVIISNPKGSWYDADAYELPEAVQPPTDTTQADE